MSNPSPQIIAADPKISAFVTANAGSGKTSTLVNRVARLLLRNVKPEAILCVTFTKAAAAEMQSRLFKTLGDWAVMDDAELTAKLSAIDERPSNLSLARALFARALETPGGLKIQTIHAFCEKLLKRFPLEAGVPASFQVLEDQAAREASARARDEVARFALEDPDGPLGKAYARFAVELDHHGFLEMFGDFETRRTAIQAYARTSSERDGVAADVWRACGFEAPEAADDIRNAAAAPPRLEAELWRRGAAALARGGARDQVCAAQMAEVAETAAAGQANFEQALGVFCTAKGEPAKWLDTAVALKSSPGLRVALIAERERLFEASRRVKSALVAEDTIAALIVAQAYAALYGASKAEHGALDFADLIARTRELLIQRSDAAWVLYKLDGGIDHILVDEAQDTAPDQWDIERALTAEFFAGAGGREAERTVFAVGDEKQSIFSFQGAEPERFLTEAGEHASLVRGAGRRFESPALIESWRSTPEVLDVVDAVFSDPQALAALRPASASGAPPVVHRPTREAGAGAVDLWELEENVAATQNDAWSAPVDADPPQSANRKLARRIAGEIKAMIARKDGVFDKDAKAFRAMGPGDVLILVRRRSALFHEIIRALKSAGIPVGGADRLTLSDHIVFDDLIGLARVCLFPWDDLELAALLRSPLFDVDEDSLYALAQPRTRSLWEELERRADERPEWSAALQFLEQARTDCRVRPPFDLYARLLNRTDASGRSVRSRILTRLGREAEQALDAFLAQALAAERRGVRDLESFAADMAEAEVEVKREQDEGHGEVRVMTVHGAKGLEAPIVILPDTATRAAPPPGRPLLDAEGGGFLWCARAGDDCDASAAARRRRLEGVDHESLRLLYVALTRARDRLIVCGVLPGKSDAFQRSWRDYVERAFAGGRIAERAVERVDSAGRPLKRYGADPVPAAATRPAEARPMRVPPWMPRPASAEPAGLRWVSPSTVTEAVKAPSPSPLSNVGGLGRFRRGDLIHKLLQILPELDPPSRRSHAARLLGREDDLIPAQRDEMISAAMAVLEDERFAPVFGPGSRAEVAVAGRAKDLPEGLAVSGRIDRLLVEDDRVLVVDYKTNRPSPDRVEDADPAYITQMAIYRAVLREVYPGRHVEAALVWTDGPKLMVIPENMMAKAIQALPGSG
jgi:ATP-dependent helicase/nuclease subunit A